MPILIGGFQKSSLIDYPEKISAVIFTHGCNFKCPYCHNPELVNGKWEMENGKCHDKAVVEFLKKRVGKLDGVVITGGEPTLHQDLPDFAKQIKEMGFCVKLDTNGTNPQMLQDLIENKLIDYVAMDIKAPIEIQNCGSVSNQNSLFGVGLENPTYFEDSCQDLKQSRYEQVVCAKVDTDNILKSIEILKTSGINYEFRTTIVKSQLSLSDFEKISKMIKGAKKYYLQRFLPTKVLQKSYLNEKTYSDDEFEVIIRTMKKYVSKVVLR